MRTLFSNIAFLFLAIVSNVCLAQQPVAKQPGDTLVVTKIDTTLGISTDTLAQPVDTMQVRITMDELEKILSTCVLHLDSTSAALESCSRLYAEQNDSLAQQAVEIVKLHNEADRLNKGISYLQQLCDSLIFANNAYQNELQEKNSLLQKTIIAMNEKENLFVEKENLYKEALAENNVNTAKLEGEINAKEASIKAKNTQIDLLKSHISEKDIILQQQKENYDKISIEKERYMAIADSLRERVFDADKKILQINEQLKYTEQRAKDAEARIAQATSRKKKVSAIQGIALKFFRTPNWQLRPEKITNESGATEVVYKIINRNKGKIEFDYITGASVMLFDLSPKNRPESMVDTTSLVRKRKSRHEFLYSYSMGIYVGFGGSNLFKNFYAGLNFKFIDFFYIVGGVNVCEYELLTGDIQEGDILPSGWAISDQISKVWKVKPFIALTFDLDFLSYIKK